MRFTPPALALLLLAALPAAAQDTPPLDEYNNVRPGLLLPEGAAVPELPANGVNGAPPEAAPEESPQVMTIDDLVAAYQRGDFALAAKRLLPLASNGQHQAEELVGIMYKNGQGFEKDTAQALIWLSKAAEANRPLAQHHLGVMHYTGEGVAADPVKALMWLHIAILHYPDGDEKKRAIEDRDNVAAQLTRRDQERALQLAREWLDKRNEGHLLDVRP